LAVAVATRPAADAVPNMLLSLGLCRPWWAAFNS
jgi:hypothetical protein